MLLDSLQYLASYSCSAERSMEKSSSCVQEVELTNNPGGTKELSLCDKLKFSNPYIFAIWWC